MRRGLARTFQSLELYDDLTVEENVSAAAFGVKGAAQATAPCNVRSTSSASPTSATATPATSARASASSCPSPGPARPTRRSLLLDEPAAGLDTTESQWLGDRIRDISATGTGILLVDHDVALVLDVCDYIYVLDFGR